MTPVRDWRNALVEAHPRLFDRSAGSLDRSTGYPTCEEGWRDLLDRMCERMETALRDGETIRIIQIKEKFASLRCYWEGDVSSATATAIMEAVALAGARSICTCEECGAEGRVYNNLGTYITRCAAHAKGVEVQPTRGRDNVHLVRRTRWTSDVYHARYDRETDSFTEVPPTRDEEE